MVIAVTNLKGGSGKTTISIHLAVALTQRGKQVCILDTDLEQRSSMKWASDRGEGATHVSVYGVEVKQLVKEVKRLKEDFDVVIIDGAPKLEKHAEIIMVVSDVVLIPTKPSILDYRSTEEFIQVFRKVKALKEMQEMEISGCIVITDADTRTLAYKDIKAAFDQLEEKVFFTIPGLVAYKDSIQSGLGVTEWENGKAKEVFERFTSNIEQLLS